MVYTVTSCLLNLVGEGGPSYLRRSCLCPMGAATGMDSAHLLLAFGCRIYGRFIIVCLCLCLQPCKQQCFQSTPSLLIGLKSSEMSSTPSALCSASYSTLSCSFFQRPSSSLLSVLDNIYVPFPPFLSRLLRSALHIDVCCICALQLHCDCNTFLGISSQLVHSHGCFLFRCICLA